MKKLYILSILALLFSITFKSYGQEDSPKLVEQTLKSEKYTIDITRISPMAMPSKTTTSEYQLKFDNNTLTTRLPYIGKIDQMGMGNTGDLSINVENQKIEIQTKYNEKKKRHELRFRAKDENSNTNCDFFIEIFNNGSCLIRLNMVGRNPISYNGEISKIK